MTNDQTNHNPTSDQASLPDLRITMARKRLTWIEKQRMHEIDCVLSAPQGSDWTIHNRLCARFDELIAKQERKIAGMEAERAAAMLARIDALMERES